MRKDAIDNKSKILKATQKLLHQNGQQKIKMTEIARVANVGVGTLYRNYGDKNELYLDLLYSKLDEFIDQQSELLTQSVITSEEFKTVLYQFIKFRESRMKIFDEIQFSSSIFYHKKDYQRLAGLFTYLFQHLQNTNNQQNAQFKADMLIATLRNDSYAFQRQQRKMPVKNLLDNLCELFGI